MVHRHLFKNRAICAPAAMIAMFIISGAAHGGGVLYVDDDAPPGGDGTSWNTAYRFLQDGLTDACGGGIAEIRVGQGTYTPDRDEANPDGTGDREATFQLCNAVALMGGYAGFGAKNPDLRDIALFVTTLSGDLLVNDGPDFANNGENSYNVTTGSGTDGMAGLDGFTITAGNANGPCCPLNWRRGAGMWNLTGSPTVSNCTFSGNTAERGGGMYNRSGSSPTVTNCTFSGNTATIAAGGMINFFASPTVTNCTFSGNTALGAGGGMINSTQSSPTIIDCTFTGNTAQSGSGGGMLNFNNSNPTVTNCTFSGNSADQAAGGVANNSSSPRITNCTFIDNFAAVLPGGGVGSIINSFPTITNCTFSGNTAPSGGGIYTTDAFGGHSETTVDNTIAWGNNPDQIADAAGAMTTVNYSDVQGGYPGFGNIDADPLFVTDPTCGDYFLSADSPCIDAADNTAVPPGVTTDLCGNPRFVDDPCTDDTGNGESPIVDMGAYEFQVTCPWDLDCSGDVGVKDLLFLLGAWGPCPKQGECPADFDNSGDVGVKDLLFLLGAWGPCP